MTEETNNPSSESKSFYSAHLDNQYTMLWKHLEYLDSNVFKLLNIFFVFSGILVVNIGKFLESPLSSALLVLMVGIVFSVLLYRTSELLTEIKTKIKDIDEEKSKLHKLEKFDSIPEKYMNGLRTSKVGWLSISIFTVFMAFHLLIH